MTGTLINTGAIIAGGLFGALFGRLIRERHQETLTMACGVGTMFLGIAGAMKYMLHSDLLPGSGGMLIVACLALGGLIGEIINIEGLFERFGEWLKQKTGPGVCPWLCDGFPDGLHRRHGDHGRDPGRDLGRLVNAGSQGNPGPDHRDGDDLFHGEGLCFFGHPRFSVGRRADPPGVGPPSGDDGGGDGVSVTGRLRADLLRRIESGLGEKDPGGQSSARGDPGGRRRLFTDTVLMIPDGSAKSRRPFMTGAGRKKGESIKGTSN